MFFLSDFESSRDNFGQIFCPKRPGSVEFSRRKSPLKDKKGGLTPAGRKYFRRTQGSKLRPGVMKKEKDMTPSDMRRKGSWGRRHFGRKNLPPLIDKNGNPTRMALQANAWGEPVPKTESAARRIADKSTRLLKKYQKLKGRT